MSLDIHDILSEPTVERVKRYMIQRDIVMMMLGRALAPRVNAILAELTENIEKNKRPE